MTINQWKDGFVRNIYKKFPRVPPQKRLRFLLGNVRDAEQAVLLKEGIIKHVRIPKGRRMKLTDYKHRIAAVFPDLFLLCDLYGMDIDHELERVMKWFKEQKDRKA